MSWAHGSDDDVDELDVSQDKEPNYGRAGITFLIDCRSDMFINDLKLSESEDGEGIECSAFVLALKCCRETMIQKIKSEGKTMISVIFFGVEKSDLSRKYIAEFQSLSESSVTKIRNLDALLSADVHDFNTKYGHSKDSHLADVLSACLFDFNGCSVKLSSKRILLFTKDDNPDGDYPDKQHQIRRRANDFKEADVDLELVPIGVRFDLGKFYKEIMQIIGSDLVSLVKPIDTEVYLNDVLEVINKVHHRKRTLARLKFSIGSQVVIGVSLYGFTGNKSWVKKVDLCRKTNEQVRSVRQLVANETGSALRPYEVKKTTQVGSKEIVFNGDELLKLRKVFEPSIVLLGFKPKASWQIEQQCHAPVFMFPDESVVKGSNQFFKALLSRCIARNVVAVCVIVTRIGSRPRYALLVPQEEVLNDETSQQILPSGFFVYYLPFARMFGNIPVQSEQSDVDAENLAVVSQIIRKIKIKNFVVDFFENPSLTKQWNNIEALALQQSSAKEFIDTTLAHTEKLGDRLKNLSIEFNEKFNLCPITSQTTKRKLSTDNDAGPSRKSIKREEIIQLISQRKVEKLTIVQLKELLKCLKNVPVSQCKKNDLVELVYANITAIKKYLE